MKIIFTNQGNFRYLSNFYRSLDLSDPSRLEISLDSNWINVNTAQLALAAALAVEVGKESSRITAAGGAEAIPASARYLDRMGLYDLTSTPSPFGNYVKNEPAGRFVPLRRIKTQRDQSNFIADLIPLYHLDEKSSRILSYIMGELIRNALEHSYSENGAVAVAQYYKERKEFSFAICDTGIGLWKSLRLWRPKTDEDAIGLALAPGISGTTLREGGTADNAGAGLFFTKSIAKISRGYFTIMSGDSAYTLLKTRTDIKAPKLNSNPLEDHHSLIKIDSRLDGTLVGIDIVLDNSAELRDLLSRISAVYDSAIAERKKAKFRKPNFI